MPYPLEFKSEEKTLGIKRDLKCLHFPPAFTSPIVLMSNTATEGVILEHCNLFCGGHHC